MRYVGVVLSLLVASSAWSQCVLRQSTAETLVLGPFVDRNDGRTPEEGLAAGATRISKDGGAFAAGPVLGAHDENGNYSYALTSGNTDTLGLLKMEVINTSVHLPYDKECRVIPANVYDSLYAGTDNLDVSLIQWLGTAPLALTSQLVQAQVNAYEASVDFNAAQDASIEAQVSDDHIAKNLDHVAGTAAPASFVADTYFDRLADDGTAVYDRTTDSLQAIVDAGGGGLTAAQVWAYDIPSNCAPSDTTACGVLDKLTEEAATLSTDVQLGSVFGQLLDDGSAWTFDRTADSLEVISAASAPSAATIADAVWDEVIVGAHDGANAAGALLDTPADWATATTVGLTAAGVDDIWDELQSGHTTAGSMGALTSGYELMSLWYDDTNGAAGTTVGTHGTRHNPSNTVADILTLSGSTNIKVVRSPIPGRNGMTLSAGTWDNFAFIGEGDFILDLNGQSCDSCLVRGAQVYGINGASYGMSIYESLIFDLTPGRLTRIYWSGISGGPITLGVNETTIANSWTAETSTAVFDFGGAVANQNLSLLDYQGAIELRNMGQLGTDVADISGEGAITINANCTGGTINLYGDWDVTDNGSATINYTAANPTELAGIVDAIWDEDIVAAHNTADTAGALLDTPGDWATYAGDGSGFSAIPWNANWDTEVESEASDALIALDLDHVWNDGTAVPAVAAGAIFDLLLDDGTAVYDRTTDSLQAISDGGGLTAAAVWDYDIPSNYAPTGTSAGAVLDKLTEETATLSTDVALGSVFGQLLDDGSAWTFDRTTDSLEVVSGAGGGTPTVPNIVAGVWDAVAALYNDAGSTGELLNNITGGTISVIQPVLDGGLIEITIGNDYLTVDGLQLPVSFSTPANLTGATGNFLVYAVNTSTPMLTQAVSVITPTGDPKRVDVDLTRVQTATFVAPTQYRWVVRLTLASGSEAILVKGRLNAAD